jgi:hypothetical protein
MLRTRTLPAIPRAWPTIVSILAASRLFRLIGSGRTRQQGCETGMSFPPNRTGGIITQSQVGRAPIVLERRRLTVARAWLGALGFLAVALGASGCSAEPAQLNQRIEVTIRGGGRDVAARFDFVCRHAGDQGGVPLYVPVPNSVLYVAPNHQALLMTSPEPHEPSYCGSDVRNGAAVNEQLVPLLIWIDDIRSPSHVDEIGMSTVGAHRKFNFSELIAFSHSSTSEPLPAPTQSGRTAFLGEHEPSLFSGRPGANARMISAARRVAKIEFASEAERESFRRLLGPEVAPGVRSLGLCRLASTEDGRDYLSREAPRLVESCPARAGPSLPRQRIRFSVPLPMKFEGPGRWLGGGADGVASFLRDERSRIEPTEATTGRNTARAPEFWQANVRTVTWITLGLRRIQLPVSSASAYYVEDDSNIVLFLEDSEIMYLKSPLEWSRL